MSSYTIPQKAEQLIATFTPARVLQSRLHKRVIMNFAEKIGLVYFGYVDQRDDDHRLVRGLTVSAHHRDNHYCIGTYQGYDMTLVERSDVIKFPGKPSKPHSWIIMEFDLHTRVDVPHTFVGLHAHSDTFYAHLFTKFSKLTNIPLGAFSVHSQAFTNKYAIYTEPDQTLNVEQLFDETITSEVAKHFGSLTIELADQCLYIYSEHQRPTKALLEKMLQCGIWLASTVDKRVI